jgi:hypothetical protein
VIRHNQGSPRKASWLREGLVVPTTLVEPTFTVTAPTYAKQQRIAMSLMEGALGTGNGGAFACAEDDTRR